MPFTPSDWNSLARTYGLGEVLYSLALHAGENRTHVLVTSRGRYVVRVYRASRYAHEGIVAELEWLEALRPKVPVVPALKTKEGQLYAVLKNGSVSVCAVFNYVAGGEVEPPTAGDFARLGRQLRGLHLSMSRLIFRSTRAERVGKEVSLGGHGEDWCFLPILEMLAGRYLAAAQVLAEKPDDWVGRRRPVYDLDKTVNGSLEHLLHTDVLTLAQKETCTSVARRLQRLYKQQEPDVNHFVHADLHFGNVLVSGPRWTLLDFDECGFSFPAFDLGTVYFHAKARGHLEEGWTSFREGYGDPFPSEASLRLGASLRMFYTAGKIPLRLDIADLKANASDIIQRYLTLVDEALEGAL